MRPLRTHARSTSSSQCSSTSATGQTVPPRVFGQSCLEAGTEWRSKNRSVWSLPTVTHGPPGPKSRTNSASPDVKGPWTSIAPPSVARYEATEKKIGTSRGRAMPSRSSSLMWRSTSLRSRLE